MENKSKTAIITCEFSFWRNNNTSEYYRLEIGEIITKFKAWMSNQDPLWIKNTYGNQIILMFLTSKDGLSSTFESTEFSDLYDYLKPYVIAAK